jgi:hypothetical protein
LEIGGTNRPLFAKNNDFKYIGLDIDKDFDSKDVYHEYYPQSCEKFNLLIQADVIYSKYLLEHVPNNYLTYSNIEKWLNENGTSVHLFPLAWHPFSVANRLVGNTIAKILIPVLRPGTEAVTGYPAFYHLCDSISLKRVSKNSNLDFKIKYFFGAEDYFGFFFPFAIVIHLFNRFCYLFNLNIFASNAVVFASKRSVNES